MFILKKLLSRMFFPVPLCLEIMLAGLILVFLRREKTGKVLLCTGLGLLLLFSMQPVADLALYSLESSFAPLSEEQIPENLKYVVVLGAGHDTVPGFPANARASSTTVERVVEGVRIHNFAPASKVVFTGGKIADPVCNARVMAELAKQLGLDPKRIIREEKSLDTADHVRYLQPLLKGRDFVLVTSASHMPRAMALFKAAGLTPIPSSTDFEALHTAYSAWDYFPSARGLEKTRIFFYECLGLAWARISGQI